MRFLWSCARKDFKRHLRDPLEIATWLGIPLLIGVLVTLAVGGKGGPHPQAYVLVADEDDSFLSNIFVGALSQDATGAGLIRAKKIGAEEGLKRIKKGKATALLRIPRGFGEALLLESPCVLDLYTNPSQQVLPEIVEEYLSVMLEGIFYVHRLLGDDLRTFVEGARTDAGAPADAAIADFSIKVSHLAEGLAKYLDPPLIRLESRQLSKEDSAGEAGTGVLFLPGILFMSLLFISLAISSDLWVEKEQHTLLRAAVSPRGMSSFLLGKIAAGVAFMLVVSALALGVGYAYFPLDPATLPFAVLWCAVTGVMLMSLLMLLQLFASSRRAGSILVMALIFPLMMLGGSFFPFEAMPSWMAAAGRLTPNGWAVEHLKNIILKRADLSGSLAALAGVLFITAVLLVVAVRRLRSKFVLG